MLSPSQGTSGIEHRLGKDQPIIQGDGDIIERAQEAWQRHRQGAAWADWMLIGEALTLGRELAMGEAEAKRPEARRYHALLGKWLERHGFRKMDKSDRPRLVRRLGRPQATR